MKKVIVALFLILTGCGKPFTAASSSDFESPQSESGSPENPPGMPPITVPDELKVCSKLSFANVVWSPKLTPLDRSAFMVALNASGSFEGDNGWANLTNNFDGQGLSMGLLNQTLGTGSLQPLFNQMRNDHHNQLQLLFSAAHFQSVKDMLAAYGTTAPVSKVTADQENSSPLDEDWQGECPADAEVGCGPKETASVTWAVNNLYNGSSFKADWKRELIALNIHPLYVSLQIRAAEKLHNKARELKAALGLKDLRSYLVMFDFVVQNGGLNADEISEYKTTVAKTPNATTQEKLLVILNIRLRRVKSQYVADVRSRKTALINGAGTVHGASRKFESEYCYKGSTEY
jgi:hypothetical protein